MDMERIKEVLDSFLDLSLNFMEFALTEKPNAKYTEHLARLRILQNKLKMATTEFLTEEEIIKHMEIFPLHWEWNENIRNQVYQFYVINAELAEKSIPKAIEKKYQPVALLVKNFERFLRANNTSANVLE